MELNFHEEFYSYAKYYDIAFDFRDVPAECRFIEQVFQKHSGRMPASFIEFGSGPAAHCLEMAKTLKKVTAVDLSPEMTAYAQAKAKQEGVHVNCECADMIRYSSRERYDVATLLMSSCSYLLTNDDVLQHLKSVASVLNLGGLYILEMDHPKSVFEIAKVTINDWEMEKDGVKVHLQWGAESDVFDPITQITNTSVKLTYEDGEKKGVLEDRAPQRCFTATEWSALVTASGVFEIVEWYGSMKVGVQFNSDKPAWRMIPVLRRL